MHLAERGHRSVGRPSGEGISARRALGADLHLPRFSDRVVCSILRASPSTTIGQRSGVMYLPQRCVHRVEPGLREPLVRLARLPLRAATPPQRDQVLGYFGALALVTQPAALGASRSLASASSASLIGWRVPSPSRYSSQCTGAEAAVEPAIKRDRGPPSARAGA